MVRQLDRGTVGRPPVRRAEWCRRRPPGSWRRRSSAVVPARRATEAELDELRAVPLPAWDEVRAAAVASPDVHTTKLVYSCRAELAATGDPIYSWLAAREVGLVT